MYKSMRAVLLLCAAISWGTACAAEPLVVMTSYLDDVVSRFEEAFERAHPEVALEFRWRMPHDALSMLREPAHDVDVYWSPAPENFHRLAEAGAFEPLADDPALPRMLGNVRLGDERGRYAAMEVAGYGLHVNPDYLAARGIALPQGWRELLQPEYAGHLMLPVPSRIGFAPLFYDGMLQLYGWERGWAIFSELAGNARLAAARGTFITSEVSEGRIGIGLTMDFFANSALASGAGGRFIYLDDTVFSQANIGIFAASEHRAAARKFVAFVRSDEGQKILFHPAIRKLPVRPAVYADAPHGYPNPFVMTRGRSGLFSVPRAFARRGVVAALFDAAITDRHEALSGAWAAVHEAERRAARGAAVDAALLAKARTMLTAMPVDEQAVETLVDAGHFLLREGRLEPTATGVEMLRTWGERFDRQYAEALRLTHAAVTGGQV